MRTTWTFHSAGTLVFGQHAVDQLGDLVRRLPARRAFVVTDQVLARVGVLEPVLASLGEAGVVAEVFDEGRPEPMLSLVRRCAAAAVRYGPDAIVALGGGSNMDVAKMAAVLLAHPGDVRDYLGDDKIPGPITPLVCVPTTAGTGSEVSGAAAFTDS